MDDSALLRGRDLDSMLVLLPEMFPWVRFLPPAERRVYLVELVETLRASEELDTLAPVAQLVTEWRHTAEVHADPTVLAALTGATD